MPFQCRGFSFSPADRFPPPSAHYLTLGDSDSLRLFCTNSPRSGSQLRLGLFFPFVDVSRGPPVIPIRVPSHPSHSFFFPRSPNHADQHRNLCSLSSCKNRLGSSSRGPFRELLWHALLSPECGAPAEGYYFPFDGRGRSSSMNPLHIVRTCTSFRPIFSFPLFNTLRHLAFFPPMCCTEVLILIELACC